MRWRSGRRSTNVDDRRGQTPRARGLPVVALLPLLRTRSGLALLLGLIVVSYCFGGDLTRAFTGAGPGPAASTGGPADETADFVSVILASTEDVWSSVFAEAGGRYSPPTLVLFEDIVRSACGTNTTRTGPFYCPPDRSVYLDLGFFRELARMGGAGDFAEAYVVGHEVGHHVQNLLGTSDQVRRAQARGAGAEANALSVLLELQADCYAGLWAHHANRRGVVVLEVGDAEEGLAAAQAIGDDRLQRQAGRAVTPDSFTHGSSRQRAFWLGVGLEEGSMSSCDTFARRAP